MISNAPRILVVEDEAIVAMALQARLENLGYAVVNVTASGEEAIVHAAELSPDLVLMDIRLAGAIDGIQAAEQIRVRYDIPVVYLTAYADQATLQRAKLTGPYSYLIKPVEESALHTAVEVALFKHGMERALKRSDQLTATGVIAAGIAHEIDIPLTSVLRTSQLLSDKLEGSLRNDALQILEEVQRAKSIVQGLLSLVRQQVQHSPEEENIAAEVISENFPEPRYQEVLTPRQVEIVRQILAGRPTKDIAEELVITTDTVATHVGDIYKRTDCTNRVSLVLWAINHGLVSSRESEG